jgi:hypothetical protein
MRPTALLLQPVPVAGVPDTSAILARPGVGALVAPLALIRRHTCYAVAKRGFLIILNEIPRLASAQFASGSAHRVLIIPHIARQCAEARWRAVVSYRTRLARPRATMPARVVDVAALCIGRPSQKLSVYGGVIRLGRTVVCYARDASASNLKVNCPLVGSLPHRLHGVVPLKQYP